MKKLALVLIACACGGGGTVDGGGEDVRRIDAAGEPADSAVFDAPMALTDATGSDAASDAPSSGETNCYPVSDRERIGECLCWESNAFWFQRECSTPASHARPAEDVGVWTWERPASCDIPLGEGPRDKIGFHTGDRGYQDGIGDDNLNEGLGWMRQHNDAGVGFFIKVMNEGGLVYEATTRYGDSNNVVVFRLETDNDAWRSIGAQADVPNYLLSPEESARQHWAAHLSLVPRELQNTGDVPDIQSRYWIETINEIDRCAIARDVQDPRCDQNAGHPQEGVHWMGRFAVETAKLALAAGYRWSAFAWSAGEPEPEEWRDSSMLEYLRMADQCRSQLSVALHEYSYTGADLVSARPHLIGRFAHIASETGLEPTILITEYGWTNGFGDNPMPPTHIALEQLFEMNALYDDAPNVLGAAIWNLQRGWGNLHNNVQRLICPLTRRVKGEEPRCD